MILADLESASFFDFRQNGPLFFSAKNRPVADLIDGTVAAYAVSRRVVELADADAG